MKRLRAKLFATCVVAASILANASTAEPYNVYHMLWDIDVGTDATAAESLDQVNQYSPGRGLVGYVPAYNLANTEAIYGLINSTQTDRMVSLSTNEGGYTYGGPLGYVYTSSMSIPGLTAFQRQFNSTTGDHMFNLASYNRSGYAHEGPLMYGFAMNLLAQSVPNTLTAGGVSITSDSIAGGAIFGWTWNSTQFVDTNDYGRLMQSTVFWQENNVWHNPTEAGSKYSSDPYLWKRQGSPTYRNYNSGNTQSTRAIPIDFVPDNWGGNSNTPVVYDQMMVGKDITLNYNNMGPVAKYQTSITTASGISPANTEIPTGYMPYQTFNTFYTYDAVGQTLTQVSPSCNNSNGIQYVPPSGYGGVIVANSTGTLAMGVYGKLTSLGGDVTNFGVFYCNAASKWNAQSNGISLPAGTKTFTTFVMSGTLADVQSYMRQLYTSGAL